MYNVCHQIVTSKGDLVMCKKILAIMLSVVLAFSIFCVPVAACVQIESINIENTFNMCLDVLIHRILTVLNIFWPGYDGKWDNIEDYKTENFYKAVFHLNSCLITCDVVPIERQDECFFLLFFVR